MEHVRVPPGAGFKVCISTAFEDGSGTKPAPAPPLATSPVPPRTTDAGPTPHRRKFREVPGLLIKWHSRFFQRIEADCGNTHDNETNGHENIHHQIDYSGKNALDYNTVSERNLAEA